MIGLRGIKLDETIPKDPLSMHCTDSSGGPPLSCFAYANWEIHTCYKPSQTDP